MRRYPLRDEEYQLDHTSSSSDDPPIWWRAEKYLREKFELEEDHGSWYDARTSDGDEVEIKSCQYKYEDGELGCFNIWSEQLTKLLLDDGYIALLVYVPTDPPAVLATQLLSNDEVSAEDGVSFRVTHPTMGRKTLVRIPWTETISLDAIRLGCRYSFLEHYSEVEREDTFYFDPPADVE
ncbi:hypothetical protein [Halorubrum aethiopicum]|uniref:hypothetical protein n=1 Tax=Halorubrum aethiopicum TaxID=1758255 RepID=UPI000AEDDE1F|nr:hypothetical protein [Halorubrum aethiopicum]